MHESGFAIIGNVSIIYDTARSEKKSQARLFRSYAENQSKIIAVALMHAGA